jgi:hypothetical protein
MKFFTQNVFGCIILSTFAIQQSEAQQSSATTKTNSQVVSTAKPVATKTYTTPFDLSTWSLTLPEEDPEKYGKPMEVLYPQIMDYKTDETIKKYFYLDQTDGALVFYTNASGITPENSGYSRTELRQRKLPQKNAPEVNWSFKDRVVFKGEYKMDDISFKKKDTKDKTIIAQIYSSVSKEQKENVGMADGFSVPALKVLWDNGKIVLKRKVMTIENPGEYDILSKDAWEEAPEIEFDTPVDFKKFTIELRISNSRLDVVLNGKEVKTFEDASLKYLVDFDSYFRTGNYLQSKDPNAFAKVKLYSLTVRKF